MSLLFITLILLLLVTCYVFFGVVFKLLWGWFPMILACLSMVIALFYSLSAFCYACFVMIGVIFITDYWQGTSLFLKVDEWLDKKLYLND